MPFDGQIENFVEPKHVPLEEQIIQRAAKILKKEAWIKKMYVDDGESGDHSTVEHGESFCAVGAVQRARYELGLSVFGFEVVNLHPELQVLADRVRAKFPEYARAYPDASDNEIVIVDFNDDPDTDYELLIEVLFS